MHRLHPYPDVQVMFRRLLIATLIGLLAALAVALFRHAMVVLETLLLSNDSGSLVNAAQSLPAWRRLVTPALGGLTAGTLLWLWQRRSVARPHAATDYMEALETGDGCFDTPASLVKSLASLLVVVTGSAIGREGAMILLAALAASLFARRFTPQSEWKLWVACGAAAGMASAYHAPLAGSLFIAEILFGTLMLASLGPVVISAVIALLLTQFLNGGAAPLYHVVLQQNLSALHYGLMLATGLLAGLCLAGLRAFVRHRRENAWWRWIYVLGGGYVLWDLFAIAAGLDFWEKLLYSMFDTALPCWDLLWGGFVLPGAGAFVLGLALLARRRRDAR